MYLIIYFLCALATLIGWNIAIGMTCHDEDVKREMADLGIFLSLVWPFFFLVSFVFVFLDKLSCMSQKAGEKIKGEKHEKTSKKEA